MKSRIQAFASRALFGAAVFVFTLAQTSRAAESSQESPAERQRKLIAVLQSDAPLQDKAITCKKLAIYGDKDAVPVLAPLLSDTNLSSWARIALEVIPGPAADEALRGALPRVQGRLLIGVINSIGVRRDAKAVEALAGKLKDADAEVVAAAAVALGKIGGTQAAKLLNQALASARDETRPAIAEGGILCAERFLADGKLADAIPLYDAVRNADVPKQRRLEATRGAILARRSAGIPLLLEQLRAGDKAVVGMALRTARELPGHEVTEALGAELDRTTPERQVMLLLALADRGDAAVLPKVLQVAKTGSKPTRVATLGLLDRFGDVSAVPVLLTSAAEDDADLTRAAKATLTRMEGKPVDTTLLAWLPPASGKLRQLIIELAALRRIEGAVPAIMSSVEDPDADIRRAALDSLRVLGTDQQAADLVRLLSKTQNAQERAAIEKALAAIGGRSGPRSLPHVLPLARNNDSALRGIAVRVLASIGGPDALAAVKTALDDRDESVQDEAVGTLATWPNNWPDDAGVAEPLLTLAKSGKKTSHQVQGVRGYLLHVQESKKLSNADKLSAIHGLLPSLKQPAEKRLAIATLGAIPTAGSVETLVALAGDAEVAEEACLAIVNLSASTNLKDASKELLQKSLQTVVEKTKSDSTRAKANEGLKRIAP
ncbi:MAG: HEAT repeat domain-containing protein [Verrucomicrobia bacterium]|nr:HEAT repeat domain-containing protein [Verrucomicrobiota bacterium]